MLDIWYSTKKHDPSCARKTPGHETLARGRSGNPAFWFLQSGSPVNVSSRTSGNGLWVTVAQGPGIEPSIIQFVVKKHRPNYNFAEYKIWHGVKGETLEDSVFKIIPMDGVVVRQLPPELSK